MSQVKADLLGSGDKPFKFKLPYRDLVTKWQLRITFSEHYRTIHLIDVTAIGGYENFDTQGIHKKLYSGANVETRYTPLEVHKTGIPGLVLGTETNAGETVVIPVTHVTGSEVMIYVDVKSAVGIVGIECKEV